MPKRLFDRLPLFGRARLDVTIATGALRSTHGRYAVNLLDMSDPSRFRDEAVVTLHELLNLGGRGHFMPSTIVPSFEGTYDAGVTGVVTGDAGPMPSSLRISRRL